MQLYSISRAVLAFFILIAAGCDQGGKVEYIHTPNATDHAAHDDCHGSADSQHPDDGHPHLALSADGRMNLDPGHHDPATDPQSPTEPNKDSTTQPTTDPSPQDTANDNHTDHPPAENDNASPAKTGTDC